MSKDIIYREDAIEVVKKWFEVIRLNPDILIDSIISIPSADRPQKKLAEALAPYTTRKNLIIADAESKGYAEGFKDGLEADRPQGWIPCSERLPEETEWIGTKKFGTTISDKVLVTFESKGERFVKPIHFQNGELGGLDKQTMDTFYGEWKAVAWMPLPEPWVSENPLEGIDTKPIPTKKHTFKYRKGADDE